MSAVYSEEFGYESDHFQTMEQALDWARERRLHCSIMKGHYYHVIVGEFDHWRKKYKEVARLNWLPDVELVE
jgi:hypothetical protein